MTQANVNQDESRVTFETTPNPSTMKFILGIQIPLAPSEMKDVSETQFSPLAQKLFGFPWMSKVYIGSNFVSITKQDWVEWEVLAQPLAALISEHIANQEAILLEVEDHQGASENTSLDLNTLDLSTIEGRIQNLLIREIQPAVAMDGGEIRFVKFENQILYIQMRGACSGCPSSTITLKEGIETRVREVFPEVQEVVSI